MQYRILLSRFLLILALSLGIVGRAWAEDIVIMNATLYGSKDSNAPGLYLNMDVEFDLPKTVEDTLTRGIPLYFITEFRLDQHRWYWVDKTIEKNELMSRLSFSPLTRQYRLSRGGLSQSFDSLKDALSVLKTIHYWFVSSDANFQAPSSFEAEIRMRLDTEQLPLPMMVGIGDAEWKLDSGWQTIRVDESTFQSEQRK